MQAASGVGFGLTSYLSRGELPEIAGAALFALYLKIACVGVALSGYCLVAAAQRRERVRRWIWPSLFSAGVTALSGAAVLRWYG